MHIAPRLSERGGADQFMLGLIEALSSQHEQSLVVGKKDADISIPCPAEVIANLDSSGLSKDPIDTKRLEALCQKYRPDLLHLHNPVHPQVLQWAQQHKALLTIQDHRFFCPGRGKWTKGNKPCKESMDEQSCVMCFDDERYFRSIMNLTRQRLLAAKPLRIHVLSEYMRRELVAVGLDHRRIHVVPPFVRKLPLADRLKHFHSSSGGYALFLGRLAEAKGVWDAVEAWRRSGIKPPLLFAGTGPERQKLEQGGYKVLGWQNRKRVSKLLRGASVLIFSPRWQEPFGIAGLEALSLGTSVAAWHSGGIEHWHGSECLTPWGDTVELAKRIRDLSDERPVTPKGFEKNKIVCEMESIYGMVMED